MKRLLSIARAEKCCTESVVAHPFIWSGLLVREQEEDRYGGTHTTDNDPLDHGSHALRSPTGCSSEDSEGLIPTRSVGPLAATE